MAYGDPPAYWQVVSGFPSGGGVPPRMSLDAVACLSGVTTAQLGGLNGPFDGAVVVTTGASATGDGLGKAWVWVEGDTATANGTTILGAGAYGRWRDATALAGSGSSAGTSVTLNPAAGQITDASTVTASNIALAITGARVYTGLLAATGGQLVKVITNTSAFDATFNHQDGAATAANRVITSSGSAFVLKAGKSATFAYDTTAQRWRIAGQDTPRADQAAALDSLTTEQLFALPAVTGATVVTTGRFASGDGGGGTFVGNASSSTAADGGRVGGTSGRWLNKRATVKRTFYAEEWLGRLDNTNKDAAFALMLAAAEKSCTEIVFPGGDLVLSQQFMIPRGVKLSGNARRADSTSAIGANGENPTRVWWDGASSTTPLFALSQFQEIEGLHFFAKPTRTLQTPVTFGQGIEGSNTFQPTGMSMRHCAVWGYGSFGNTTFCGTITIGPRIAPGLVANADYPRFEDCTFANISTNAIDVVGGQPYHIEVTNCTFAAEHIAALNGYVVWGRALNLARGSSSIIARGCVFSRVEEVAYLSGDAAFLKLIDCDVEYAKKILVSPSGFYQGRTDVQIHGRFELFSGIASANYAASDSYVIDSNYGIRLSVAGPITASDGTDILIGVGEHSTVEMDANWGSLNPVRRRRVLNVPHSGGTFYRGKAYLPEADTYGLVLRPMVQTSGCENPDTFFDIGTDAARGSDATVVEMGFSPEEVDVPLITVSASTLSGTPAAGTWAVSNASTTGYRLTRSAAVGTGGLERVVVKYSLPNTDITPAAAVEAAFGSATLMATAVNAGPIGNASGCWWQFVVSRFGPNTGGIFHTICGAGNSNTGWVLIRNQNGGFYFSTNNIASVLAGEGTTITTPPMLTDLFTAVYTGTQLKAYVSGVLVQTVTGAFTPLTTERFRIGQNSQYDRPNTNSALHSMNYGTGVPSDSQVLAAAAQARKYGYTRPIVGSGITEQNRYLFGGTGAATDVVGGANITLVSGTQPGTRLIRKAWRY